MYDKFFAACKPVTEYFRYTSISFKIPEAEHGKRSIAERLFKGEAYSPVPARYLPS
ncbi:MAG: hypothetical protein LBK06_06810 [Planctomycetaceae bacterium]|nr:hypothetical protein [Planctomycetaceae bacterium]